MQRLHEAQLISLGELEEADLAVHQESARVRQIRLQVDEARERQLYLEESLSLTHSEQTQETLDLQLQLRQLEEQQAGLEAEIELLSERRAALGLHADIDGVVSGESLPELLGRSVERGEPILSIIDTRSIFLETLVPEEAIVHMRLGQAASVEIQGLPKLRFRTFQGRITTIDPRPQEDPIRDRTLYSVHLTLEQPWVRWEGQRFYLRHGMRGRAAIVYRPDVPLARVLLDFLTGR